MKKVCHMTSAHGPEDVRIFYKECVSLAKAGYEVYLVERGESYDKDGVHIVGVGQPSGGRLSRITTFSKKVYEKALSLDCEIYHFHDPELLPWGLKLKKQGKKVIFDSHEKYTEQLKRKPYLPRWCTEIIACFYGFYERAALKKLDGLIFPCLKDGLHPFKGQCKRVITLDNFPMLSELYERFDQHVVKHPDSVCYVGGLTYSRGITHLVDAAHLAGAIAYFGGVFLPATYEQELKSRPGFTAVRYLGALNRTQVLDTLQRCQIGMACILNIGQYNQFDNLATKVYEYMSLGLPVILTRAPYNERIIERYHCGICVNPENVDEIAAAIRYLLDRPEEARQMGENGRRAIKEEFNWGVEEQKLFALYRDILKEQ